MVASSKARSSRISRSSCQARTITSLWSDAKLIPRVAAPAGAGACRCWNEDQERIDMPEDLRDCTLVPRVQIKSLWLMGDSCGITCDVVDMLVFAIKAESPFVDDA